MLQEHDIERSFAIAKDTLNYLREFNTPAVPRNYELFYAYTVGRNAELLDAVRDAVAKHACLSEKEASRLFDVYVGPNKVSGRLEEVGSQMSGELGEIMQIVKNAIESTGAFGQSLEGLSKEIGAVSTAGQLKAVVGTLAFATRNMAANTQKLEDRLEDARSQIAELHHTLESVRAESLTDELTHLSNRKRFDQILDIEALEARDSLDPLCLVMADIDHFKGFNDTYGHAIGDQVIKLVASTIRSNVKGRDHPSRYGGEEFAILLPKTTLEDAVTVANQIRRALKSRELVRKSTGESLGRITMSMGVAVYRPGEPLEDLFQRADTCLYAAKAAGRNKVCAEQDGGAERTTITPMAAAASEPQQAIQAA